MPYYCVTHDDSPLCESPAFATRSEAYREKTGGQTVRFVSTIDEENAWIGREENRFLDGTYSRVPWPTEAYPRHFVHLSVESPGLVAYTPDDESGYANRKVSLRPGRYLERFYSDVDLATRARWIALVDPASQSFAIARTADDIEELYENAVGFHSCMGPKGHATFDYSHPCRAYGDSDLAVAYLGPLSAATARAVIWPAKKTYSRAYGLHDQITAALIAAGYSYNNDQRGARLRCIVEDGRYIVPYCDGASTARDTGDGYLVLGNGPISVRETCGYFGGQACSECNDQTYRDSDLCESCTDRRTVCGHCEDVFFDDDNPPYCQSCEDERRYCECCDNDTWERMYFSVERDQDVCDDCARTHADSRFTCLCCGARGREWTYSRDQQSARADSGTAGRYCLDCAKIVVLCHVCTETLEKDEDGTVPAVCPYCGGTARCEHTADLLGSLPSTEVGTV